MTKRIIKRRRILNMNSNIVITDSLKFREVIDTLKKSYERIKESFDSENKNLNKMDGDNSIWKSRSQDIFYEKYSKMMNQHNPIEESLGNYLKFLEETISKYEEFEKDIDKNIDLNNSELNVN